MRIVTDFISNDKGYTRVQQIFSYYEKNVWPKWIKDYQSYAGDMTPRKAYIDTTWQSNISSGITKKTIKTFFAHIYDNLIKFYVSGASESEMDKEQATLCEEYLMWTYSVSKTKRFLHMQILDALIIGEGYGKVGFKTVSKNKKYVVPKYNDKGEIISGEVKTKKIFKQNGTYEYIAPFDLLIDPAAKDPYAAPIKIKRELVPESKIREKYGMFFQLPEDKTKKLISDPKMFVTKDRTYQRNQILVQDGMTNITSFNGSYAFDKNKYIEMVEVWIDDGLDGRLELWANGRCVYNAINPYPIEEDPFTYLYFSLEGGTIRGTGLAGLLRPYDDMASAFLNAYIDDLKIKSKPILLRVAGKSQIVSTNNEVERYPGQVITVEDVNQLQPLNIGGANVQVIDLVNFMENAAFMAAGVNEIVMGSPISGGKVPRVAGDVVNRVQGFKVRLLSLFDSLNDVMSKTGKFWMGLGNIYMQKETVMKIFNDETKLWTWRKINAENLDGEFDIVFDTEALKTAYKEIRIAQLTQFLSVIGNNAIDPSTGMPVINFGDLIKQLAQYLDLKANFIYTDKEAVAKIEKAELQKIKTQEKVQAKTMEAKARLDAKTQPAQPAQPEQAPAQGVDIAQVVQNLAAQGGQAAPVEGEPEPENIAEVVDKAASQTQQDMVAPENIQKTAINDILTPQD